MKLLTIVKLQVLLIFLLISVASSSFAADYYISPKGSNNNSGKQSSPWATFDYAMDHLRAGDTLIIKNGTYYQSLKVTVSGKSGSPITFKAENDGKVIIDGGGSKWPCQVWGDKGGPRYKHINIEGIVCTNSVNHGVQIAYADNINIRRVTSGNHPNKEGGAFNIYNTTYVLLEDTAGYGPTRRQYNIYESEFTTVRRCWGMFESFSHPPGTTDGDPDVLALYGSNNSIVENCVVTQKIGSDNSIGLVLWAWDYNKAVNNNKLYGNISYDLDEWGILVNAASTPSMVTGNELYHNVAINTGGGLSQRADNGLVVENLTVANTTDNGAYSLNVNGHYTFSVSGNLKNSSISSPIGIYIDKSDTYFQSFTSTYNNLYKSSTNYKSTSNETYIDPKYDTTKYGNGAYLMVPPELKGQGENGADIGAEVLYRYKKGVINDGRNGRPKEKLWPWPMEDRICKETGFSVTYENGYSGCSKGGGLWKSPEALASVYQADDDESNNSSSDESNTPPSNESNTPPSNDVYNYIIDINPEGTYIDAENFTGTIQGESTFSLLNDTLSDYAGSGYLQTGGKMTWNCANVSAGKEYKVNFTDTGLYNIWIRGYGADGSSDSIFIGVDGACIGALNPDKIYGQWVWTNNIQSVSDFNTFEIITPGIHTINIWIREPNFLVDGIYLTMGTEDPPDELAHLDSIPPAPPMGLLVD